MDIKLLFLLIVTEGLIELWFEAVPIQIFRNALIKITPFLYSKSKQKHPFNCEYCMSVWISGFLCFANYYFQFIENSSVFFHFLLWIFLHRGSNLWHVIFSYIRDLQRNLLIARNKKNAS